MSQDIAVRVDNLGKRYRIGALQKKNLTLKDTLGQIARGPFDYLIRQLRGPSEEEILWALRNVSFEVKRGEVLGIIGRNGAGKSTLLKILSRITEPTEGHAEIHGRVGSLLEVGTGFHPELTGRENVYLNGAILGMSRQEIDRKFDEIVEFAGVERFIDTPVKRYSSGMYVRLAFAVAAHLEPEILIVDEVLAVGDAEFQRKALGKMEGVVGEGRTVLFVSHNMGAVRSLCPRVIFIDKGQVMVDGAGDGVVTSYLQSLATHGLSGSLRDGRTKDGLQITRVVLKDEDGNPASEFAPGASLTVEMHYHAPHAVERPYFWLAVVSQYGPLFMAAMLLDGHRPAVLEGKGVLSCTFRSLPLVPQIYTVRMGVRARDGHTLLTPSQEVGCFHIVGRLGEYGLRSELADATAWNSASMVLPYEWHLPDGRRVAVEGLMAKEPHYDGVG